MSTVLLATDLDKTLIGDDEALAHLNQIITGLKSSTDFKLAYVTGRSLELYVNLTEEKTLIVPDALVTSIGTEIQIEGKKLTNWPLVQKWNVPELKSILARHASLQLQPDTEQREFKLSYYLESDNQLVKLIREELHDYPVDIVYSMDIYLDILPRGTNKGSALHYLANKWDVDPKDIYACGDSGNDIDMLARSNAIIVANAKEELLEWTRTYKGTMYIAKSEYANGIIEGLKHYHIA